MLHLLFAEDEKAAREGILASIDWDAIGVSVQAARNGQDAFRLAQSTPPDVLLTDIRMPLMDGIELAKRVREINPECSILFISSYSEVDYLKSIIALHAVDFVEKPVEITLLESRLKEAVEAQRMQRLQQALLSESLVQSLNYPVPVSAETFALLRRAAGQIEMNTPCRAFLVKPVTEDGRAVTDSTLFSVMGQLRDGLQEAHPRALCGLCDDTVHLAFFGEKASQPQLPEQLEQQLRKWAPESVLYLCAGSVERAESYHLSLQAARENLKHLFYGPDSRVLTELPSAGERPLLPIERFETAIRSGDRKDAAACIRELAEAIHANHKPSPVRCAEWFSRMLMLVLGNRGDEHTAAEWLEESVFLRNMADDLLLETERYFDQRAAQAGDNRMEQIVQYIRENYADQELSLHKLSTTFYLSDAYLCVRFKEATGTTIVRYITECRMQKAAELLLTTEHRISDIAAMVGFEDAGYFTRLFRKEKGVPPAEFRKKI